MFLLSSYYFILSSHGEGQVKKNQVWISCLRLVFRPPKSGCFFKKIFYGASLEIIFTQKQSPGSLIFDFLTVSHMVWNNQESCESLLVGFWISRHSKMQTISVNNLFFACLSCHYGFTDYFEILIFLFSNIISRGVLSCKILLF